MSDVPIEPSEVIDTSNVPNKPTRSSRRLERQNLRARYEKLRTELQDKGMLPTTPEGSLRQERVRPEDQSEDNKATLKVAKEALARGWSVPNSAKPIIVDKLLEPFNQEPEIRLDAQGNQVEIPPNRQLLLETAKVLRQLDQTQYERDNPELAGKAKGGTNLHISTSQVANSQAANILRQAVISQDLDQLTDDLATLETLDTSQVANPESSTSQVSNTSEVGNGANPQSPTKEVGNGADAHKEGTLLTGGRDGLASKHVIEIPVKSASTPVIATPKKLTKKVPVNTAVTPTQTIAVVNCPRCEGTGTYLFNQLKRPCRLCKGKKKVLDTE